jgi:hypothetical protein
VWVVWVLSLLSNYVEAVAESTISPTAQPLIRGPPPVPAAALGNSSAGRGAQSEAKSVNIHLDMPRSSAPAAARGASSGRGEKIRVSATKFGLWSANMAQYLGISMIIFGAIGFIWYNQGADPSPIVTNDMTLYCSIYCFFLGFLVLIWEYFFGRKRTDAPFPIRGLMYTIFSLFLFMSWPTILCGFCMFITAMVNFVASAMGEVYDAPKKEAAPPAKVAKTEAEQKAEGLWGMLLVYVASVRQQNKVGQFVFINLYVAGNAVLFGYTIWIWQGKISDLKKLYNDDATRVPSGWAPLAKACGALLDLNCALILLPVLRTLLRWCYNRSTQDQNFVSKALRAVLFFIPLDRNLIFHKIIAKVVLGATIAHTLVHYINFSIRPQAVLFLFEGSWPLISGGIVCISMFFIYTAAL